MTDGWNSLLCRFAYADARTHVAMEWGGRTYYLSYDQAGSLRQVTDYAGKAVKVVEYDSFGNLLRDSAPGFYLPIGFAGGLSDRHTGLVRFGYRDYDPGIGRWTAKDPLGFAGGDVDLFGYVGNDPVNGVDAAGLWTVAVGGAGSIQAIGALGGDAGYAFGYSKEKGFTHGPVVSINAGIGTPGTFAGGFLQVTNDSSVDDLKGWSVQAGGGVQAGVAIGADTIVGLDMSSLSNMLAGPTYVGFQGSIGGGFSPFFGEIHEFLAGSLAHAFGKMKNP